MMRVSIPSDRESALQDNSKQAYWLYNQLVVSIPSDRESALQATEVTTEATTDEDAFPFPPNGKVLCKRMDMRSFRLIRTARVSIPSERESALQAHTLRICFLTHILFPFPPNGKVLCKTET